MKRAKLIVGILSTVLGAIVLFQSCTVSSLEVLADEESESGAVGIAMALILLVIGIVSICTHKGSSRIVSLILAVVYALVGNAGIQNAENFPDLEVWGGISFCFAIVYIIIFLITFSAPKGKNE